MSVSETIIRNGGRKNKYLGHFITKGFHIYIFIVYIPSTQYCGLFVIL